MPRCGGAIVNEEPQTVYLNCLGDIVYIDPTGGHETFHLWNGDAIEAAHQQDVEWFVEGFTEYMAKLVLFRTGAISEAELFAELAENDDSYRANEGRGVPLKGAGVPKGENYALD